MVAILDPESKPQGAITCRNLPFSLYKNAPASFKPPSYRFYP